MSRQFVWGMHPNFQLFCNQERVQQLSLNMFEHVKIKIATHYATNLLVCDSIKSTGVLDYMKA